MQTHYPLYERHATNKINYEESSMESKGNFYKCEVVKGEVVRDEVVKGEVFKGEVVIEAKVDESFTNKFSQMKQIKEY